MSTSVFRLGIACGAAAFTVVLSTSADAQVSSRPDPSNPKAEVPALRYESHFKGYRKFEEESVTSWRGANDLAHKLGGWKAFANDQVSDVPAEVSGNAAPPKPAPQQAPVPGGGHAGHKTK